MSAADPAAFRAEFPICVEAVWLNAGTCGPLARAAVDAARETLQAELEDGRWMEHYHRRIDLGEELRAAYATVLGCTPADVALTNSTSEGLGKVLTGLHLGPGDEILSSDQEHPGLLGPLLAARARGVRVRMAPLESLASAVEPSTTVVACSHVSWVTGDVADPGLAEVDVPVIFDGAQGAGAVPLDVGALGCDAYAAAGQKWMCGPDGTGMLYVSSSFRDRVEAVAPGYFSFASTDAGLDSPLYPDARRYDTPALPGEAVAMSLAAAGVLANAGWDWVHSRACGLAARLADELAARGRSVGARADTTLVAFEDPDPPTTTERLNAAGIIVRNIPGTPYIRASVGAWNNEEDLARLVEAI